MKTKKRTFTGAALILISVIGLTACSSGTSNSTDTETQISNNAETTSDAATEAAANTSTGTNALTVDFTSYDTTAEWDSSSATTITLNQDEIAIDGTGATATDTTVTITSAGTYVLTGTLKDGQIVVEAADTEKVQLVLNNVDITSLTSAAIYVKNADKTLITLAEGGANTLTDASTYTYDSTTTDEPSACIFSKDDLTINGTGTLVVNGNYNNGIDTSNDLKIVSGNITVTAVNNGLKGNDSIGIMGGDIIITSEDDGIKTDNETETNQGFFYMSGGIVNVTAADDGIVAITSVLATGGELILSTGDKDVNCDKTLDIADGILVSK